MTTKTAAEELGDFRSERRVLTLAALAIPVGLISAFVAKALLWLIALVTNLAFFTGGPPCIHWPMAATSTGLLLPCLWLEHGARLRRSFFQTADSLDVVA